MPNSEDLDRIQPDQPQLSQNSVKWGTYPGTIGAFVAEMDFGTAPSIKQALHRMVDEGPYGYLPQSLEDRLSEATSRWYERKYSFVTPAKRIFALPDVLKGLELTIERYTTPGSKVIVPTPAYMPFLTVPRLLGREVIEVPMLQFDGRYEYDLEGVDRAFDQGGELLIVCNPYNPLGRVFSHAELSKLSDVVAAHSGRVFSDEIHAPLVYAPNRHVPYASISDETASHTITATSASKSWNLPGLKCAQLLFHNDDDAQRFAGLDKHLWHSAANPGLVANIAAYTHGEAWLNDILQYLDGSRKLLQAEFAEHLPEITFTTPEGTYIAWLDARKLGLDSPAEFFRDRAKVSLTDGAACGEAGRGGMRLVFATPRPVLRNLVRSMAKALNER